MAARVKNPRGYRNINNGCSSNYNNEGRVNMTAFFTGNIYIVSGTQKSHSALAQRNWHIPESTVLKVWQFLRKLNRVII